MSWDRQRWKTPVFVQLAPHDEPTQVVTVEEAMNILTNRWPAPKSGAYWQAANACSLCLNGQVGSLTVRAALVAAAHEAGFCLQA